ncbi:alkyl sulfatase-like hydrolase [Novosphingobium sp. AP12]|nr:alkyl sulfatase-like hydrolase [Novosphingobium sp. AP12]
MWFRLVCTSSIAAMSLLSTAVISQEAAPGSAPQGVAPAQAGKPADAVTTQRLRAFAKTLPTSDREDYELVQRGFIASVADGKLRTPDGQPAGDVNTDAFFSQSAPSTVNPSLWRNAQLLQKHGLFKVSERIYQIRGFAISNMTVIVGDTGYIIVDPGYDAEAYTGIQLVYKHLGRKPITGVIYTHSHTDHYAGVRAIISDEDVAARKVPVVAPEGFIKEILGESVIAGPAMIRRAAFQFGFGLPVDATGNVNLGLGPQIKPAAGARAQGQAPARGRLPIVPNHDVKQTGETLTIDGLRFEFQMAANTEAPAEMFFYLPDLKALCLAEDANGTLHNALPARGALVRDTKSWANALTESISRYGSRTEVLFTSHFWPRWGSAKIVDYLGNQRDAYEYLHDQSVRLMNDGLTGPEIARAIQYPDTLAAKWYNHEYYGTLSHNSRAVYQRYMGYYDGNPANLDPMTLTEGAAHYVEALGGGARVLELAGTAIGKGDNRWAVELLNKLVFAEPANRSAQVKLADLYEQLAYQAESATWRNGYLEAATELRRGPVEPKRAAPFAGLLGLPTDLLLDALAVRLVPERAKGVTLAFTVVDPATGRNQVVQVRNSVLVHQDETVPLAGAPVLKLSAPQFYAALTGEGKGSLSAADQALVRRFAELFDGPLGNFAIVTP